MTFYVVCAAVIAIGALFAVLDWRWIRRPLFGVLLLAGLCGGLITTQVSPFNFADGGYYMQGVIAAAGSTLAMIGYGIAVVVQLLGRHLGRHQRT